MSFNELFTFTIIIKNKYTFLKSIHDSTSLLFYRYGNLIHGMLPGIFSQNVLITQESLLVCLEIKLVDVSSVI